MPLIIFAPYLPAARQITVVTPGNASEGESGAEAGMLAADADGYAAFRGITVSIRFGKGPSIVALHPAAVT